eukprot:515391-Hanusia_phi.AAC.1
MGPYPSAKVGCVRVMDVVGCPNSSDLQVSVSERWKAKARANVPEAHQYDWTYSTKYKGTFKDLRSGELIQGDLTEKRIDFESLKVANMNDLLRLICNWKMFFHFLMKGHPPLAFIFL